MKTILVICAVLTATVSLGQDFKIDPETKLITYSDVIEVQGASKTELFLRSSTWLLRAFKTAKAGIDFSDKEAGKIIAKGDIATSIKMPLSPRVESGNVQVTITIQCKDGKYKYTIDNLLHFAPLTTGTGTWVNVGALEQEKLKSGMLRRPSTPEWNALKKDVDEKIIELIGSLKKALSKSDSEF